MNKRIASELLVLARELESSEWAPSGLDVPSSDSYSKHYSGGNDKGIRDLVKTKYGKALSESKAKDRRKIMRSKIGRDKVVKELFRLAEYLVRSN
jgi:hypothetical protein